MPKLLSPREILELKLSAKVLKLEENLTHGEALNIVALEADYKDWPSLAKDNRKSLSYLSRLFKDFRRIPRDNQFVI